MGQRITIELGTLSDGLFAALLEDDPGSRREAMFAWKDAAAPALQSALPDALAAYAEAVLDDWGKLRDEYRRAVAAGELAQHNNYAFVVEIRTVDRKPSPVSEAEGVASAGAAPVAGGGGGGYGPAGRSPNDDRSNSMNPNNTASRAAMDNRANQLNPNNPAHRSSRGLGRR